MFFILCTTYKYILLFYLFLSIDPQTLITVDSKVRKKLKYRSNASRTCAQRIPYLSTNGKKNMSEYLNIYLFSFLLFIIITVVTETVAIHSGDRRRAECW